MAQLSCHDNFLEIMMSFVVIDKCGSIYDSPCIMIQKILCGQKD